MLLPLRNAVISRPFAQHFVCVVLLSCLNGVLFFYGTERRALCSSHEGRAGQHAQLMLDRGEWGLPRLYSVGADYQKPPLYYWMVAATAWLRGGDVDAWSIRFPAAASAIACVLVVYTLAARTGGVAAGLVAALALACNLRFSWLARVGRIDMPLALAVTVVMIAFWCARSHRGWLGVSYIAAAAAVMLKGPVGLVLPAVAVGLFLVIEREPIWPWRSGFGSLCRRLGVGWGSALVLLLAAPWFVWAAVATRGEFLRTFFLHHNWNRALGADGLKPGPVWYYVPQLMFDFLPWSVAAIPVLATGVRRSWAHWRRAAAGEDSAGPYERFLTCWCVGMFVFLSLVRFKRHDYLLPVLPGLALLLALRWQRLCESAQLSRVWHRLMGWSAIGCAATVGLGVCVLSGLSVDDIASSAVGERWVGAADRILLGRIAQRTQQASWAALAAAAIMLGTAVAGFWVMRRGRVSLAAVMIGLAWSVLFMAYVTVVVPAVEPLHDQRPIATAARRLRLTTAPVYYYGREDQQLMFYLGGDTKWLHNRTMLRPVIAGTEPVLVIMDADRFAQRQRDWPEVVMRPIARNTDNAFGTHENSLVLVANEAGWRLVQQRPVVRAIVAN
jgi:4-amino-4-deoxy-L-arabinose transferase-like glycosyltransferase